MVEGNSHLLTLAGRAGHRVSHVGTDRRKVPGQCPWNGEAVGSALAAVAGSPFSLSGFRVELHEGSDSVICRLGFSVGNCRFPNFVFMAAD